MVDRFARSLLHAAVRTPSPSGSEAAVVARVAALLDGRVDDVATDAAGNLVVRQGHGPRTVTFLAHVDTVPGEVSVEERDGALYGRGAVDAKGPWTAALAAAVAMPPSARERLTVRVVGAVGEEAPGSVGARHAAATLPAPEALIVCEPSSWDAITLGYKGHLRMRVTSDQASHHSAGPEPSAGDRLVAAIGRLREACRVWSEGSSGAFDALQCTVLDLAHEHDGLRERAQAAIGIRTPVAWPAERLMEAIRGLAEWTDAGLEVTTIEAVDAVRAPRDGMLPRAFRTAIRSAGGRPRTLVKTGTSDWNVVAGSWPVPTVAYGPGDSTLDHAPNEHLDLASFDAAVEVLGTVLDRLGASLLRDRTDRSSSE